LYFFNLNKDIELVSIKHKRSGSFIDNMKLPIHRWFRYSAGFSAEWVKTIVQKEQPLTILDPFAGSGTVNIASDELGINSFGYEQHPFVYKLSLAKTHWNSSVHQFLKAGKELLELSRTLAADCDYTENTLLAKCYSREALSSLLKLRKAWLDIYGNDTSSLSKLLFLAITAILRSTSSAGTAQWQYVLPEKKKHRVIEPRIAFETQLCLMASDMKWMQSQQKESKAILFNNDARTFDGLESQSIDLVITSPPYANNYDYADATRLEMTFWGDISSWGDLHSAVRQYLICSNTQHAAKEKYHLNTLLDSSHLTAIREEISVVCSELASVRETKGGKKHYHTMIAAYFNDMAQVMQGLRRVVRPNKKLYFVVGDSAPYGVYVPVEKWLGNIALNMGFTRWNFEKLRDRNVKWKNRKHQVPLHEGILVIES
ncbi:hypothetical protein, partial [Akkermansia sp.]